MHATAPEKLPLSKPVMQIWDAVRNVPVCDEHYRLTIRGPAFPQARPGQFVTIACPPDAHSPRELTQGSKPFLLRRAFSIADLRALTDGVEIDILYHAVGSATKWMAGLGARDRISVMGPLGNGFPSPSGDKAIWIVGGGIGLPPVLWLAKTLTASHRPVLIFVGTRTARLLPLAVRSDGPVCTDGITPSRCIAGLATADPAVIVCTDDGSLGYRGTVLAALRASFAASGMRGADLVIYACGPEPMLRNLAIWAVDTAVECYLCTERTMACGMGTCQSCAIPVRADAAPDGWCYKLCCTDGPVFPARQVLWTPPSQG